MSNVGKGRLHNWINYMAYASNVKKFPAPQCGNGKGECIDSMAILLLLVLSRVITKILLEISNDNSW